MSNGICTAVLRGHSSLVKGVTWDPIGSFIASQSDDKTVIIWRTSDWSLAHRTEGHWAKSLGSTFFRRLGWSPCGHYITTTHGFQKPRHSAPVLERGEWSATFDFLGHNAPVIVVKFNHSMFRRNSPNAQEVKNASLGWSNGSSKSGGKESQPYNVIAIGSQDRTITVWTTASPRPLFVAKHFFSQSVVDLSWSPDGYSLFACSLDGSVATFHFDGNELGHRLSEAELEELKKSRYGDVRGRQANLPESPAQLLLEAAAAKQTPIKKQTTDLTQVQATSKSFVDLNVVKVPKPQSDNNGEKTEGVNSDSLNKPAASKRLSSPVKQREYRRPDGRKRIIPEAVGNISAIAQSPVVEFPNMTVDQRKDENGMVLSDASVREGFVRKTVSVADQKERSGVTARATISESLVIERIPPSAGKDGSISIEQMGIGKDSAHVGTGGTLLIRVSDNKEGEDTGPICLEAQPREQAANDILGPGNSFVMKETEILCTRGSQTLWSDRISGKVTVLAGNANFWAVGCEDGCVQIYTKCGRRAMPTMMMGSAAVFADCDESWKFLLVTRKGSLYVWDLFNRKCLLQDSLASLMNSDRKANAGTIKVISAKLSKSGFPLVILVTRHAYLFDMSLMCWLRVADDCFPASNFSSSWSSGLLHGGELAALQVDVRKFLARRPGWSRVTDDGVQTRAHLEAQLASALALKSPSEYRQCLLSYVRFLARGADEPRLREVCENFLGPPTGMTEAASSDSNKPAWDPCVLGMKKQRLLREDILPAMASNRKVQRLLNEFMDLLSEYEISDTNLEPNVATTTSTEKNLEQTNVATTTSVLSADKMDTDLPTTQTTAPKTPITDPTPSTSVNDRKESTDHVESSTPLKDPMDSVQQKTDETKSIPPPTDQMNLDAPASVESEPISSAKEKVS
ncbi:hypothetical protein RND71_020821 [Anisodus tanguticus]|uniref:Protein HIRA n=1 Tax=Anisodus tanguticus TaxID=243964 RepID=A0AAE1RWY7_9SOLA|nr:hypothetical protein RND71_020821 [Anisodus tanguticus]